MTDKTTARAANELARIAALERMAILDTDEEKAYDDITRMAASICGTPIALISLTDRHRQWFKSRVGMQMTEAPRESSFCAHALETPTHPFVVRDASKDYRFKANPLVTNDPNIRFYAGAPLVTSTGQALGVVCVLDSEPRDITLAQMEQLQFLAQQVITLMESRSTSPTPD